MSEYTKGEITIKTPFSLIDNEIFEAKGRLVAKCWRNDVAEILLNILNSQSERGGYGQKKKDAKNDDKDIAYRPTTLA